MSSIQSRIGFFERWNRVNSRNHDGKISVTILPLRVYGIQKYQESSIKSAVLTIIIPPNVTMNFSVTDGKMSKYRFHLPKIEKKYKIRTHLLLYDQKGNRELIYSSIWMDSKSDISELIFTPKAVRNWLKIKKGFLSLREEYDFSICMTMIFDRDFHSDDYDSCTYLSTIYIGERKRTEIG